MANNLPALSRKVALETKYKSAASGFEARSSELLEKPLSFQLVYAAHLLDTEAKHWLGRFDLETKPIAQQAYKTWKAITDFRKKMTYGAELARKRCADIQAAWDQKERLRIAAENTERVRKAKEEMPGVPAVVVKTEAPVKIEGQVITYKASCESMNLAEFLQWIVEGQRWDVHTEVFGEYSTKGIEALLARMATVIRETLTVEGAPPGVTPIAKPIVQNRS